MEQIELKAVKREKVGKSISRAFRRSGMIPAVLYGYGHETEILSVNTREFEKALRNRKIGNLILNLSIGNGESPVTKQVMIKEIQRHPLTQSFLHADFYEVTADRKIRVRVPIETVGKSIGVELGGSLQIIHRELVILCLPSRIPDKIQIDVTDLNIGDVVHAKDIQLGEGIDIPAEANLTILTVLSRKGLDEAGEEKAGAEGEEKAEAVSEE